MIDERGITTAPRSRRRGALRGAIVLGLGCSLLAAPASGQSITDRFKSLFGGSSEPAQSGSPPSAQPSADGETDLTCPAVSVRAGASTYAVGLPGKTAAGNDLRFQATIGRTARDCTINGGIITARIGIQGRVIAGPAGAPASVDVPLRVAVVQEGVTPKTIFTKAYQTNVAMDPAGNVPFSLVAEDVVFPAPSGAVIDSYVFYIGFDPQALKPEPKPKAKKK
jgi:hypothetical protein